MRPQTETLDAGPPLCLTFGISGLEIKMLMAGLQETIDVGEAVVILLPPAALYG